MKKSIGLLSALVVSTTFIVNCQKAPDKRRVRPSGGSGGGAQTDITQEKAKLPTKVCAKELLDIYRAFHKNNEALKKSVITAASTDADKEAHKKLGVETLAKCDELINSLKVEQNEGCYLDNGVKDLSNALTTTRMQNGCNVIGEKLKTDVDLDNAYANAAKEAKKVKEDTKKVELEIIGKSLRVSKEARQLLLSGNTDGGKFLINGEINSTNSSLEQGLAASSTVCTFLGKGLTIEENTDTTLKIMSTSAAEKADLQALKADFAGKSTLLSTEVSQAEEKETISLLCLNLDSAKLSVDSIKKALGTGIASAPTQVTTEVTGGTSEAAVVTTPAVSAASSTVSATTTVVASAPVASAAVSATAQVSGTAQVTLVPATGVSSPAVAAKVEAEGKATKEELASMKEKAERLEKEAKDAEAEVTKLETEKAKAEDIDQAKAKARIARESANSAKAEYDAAAKQA